MLLGFYSVHHAEREIGKSVVYYSAAFRIQMADVYCIVQKLRKALKGEMQTWGFLKRTGNVKEIATLKELFNWLLRRRNVNL
jgi:hypothetical protein